MQTTIHVYQYDLTRADEKAAYAEMCSKLKDMGVAKLKMGLPGEDLQRVSKLRALDGSAVTLETKHLFGDQWNTAEGLRVLDWWEAAFIPNKNVRAGQWLEQTAEMREIRRSTVKCGYCGAQEPAAAGSVFHLGCLDDEYLKEEDLFLLRMMPIDQDRADRAPLSEAEKAHLLPQYRDAQIHGSTERGRARMAKARADVVAKANAKITNAETERDGFLWLMDQGYDTSNVIFYSHTGRFCFGWRQKLSGAVLQRTLEIVCEFPFSYDLKCADGRTLSGEG